MRNSWTDYGAAGLPKGLGADHSNDPNPVCCVLLSSFQGERYIAAQIDSILAQRDVSVRLVIRDDGSSDSTVRILEDYQARFPQNIVLLLDRERLGVKKSFERLMAWALAHAETEYFCLSDQDDIWLPEKLGAMVRDCELAAISHPTGTPILVHSDLTVVNQALEPIALSFWRMAGMNPRHNRLNELVFGNTVTGCASLFNRALVKVALPIPDVALMHDHWLALCARILGQVVVIDQTLVLYRQHSNNVVGAVRGDSLILRLVRLVFKGPSRKEWEKVVPQASALLEAHGAAMPAPCFKLLRTFVELPRMGPLRRRWFLIRYRFAPGSLSWPRRIGFWLSG